MTDSFRGRLVLLVAVLGRSIRSHEAASLRKALALRRERVASLTYWENEERGIALASKAGSVCCVFLFAAGKDGFKQYRGTLPCGIAFGHDKTRVRAAMGRPSQSGPPDRITSTLAHGGWDRYVLPECRLHITYAATTGQVALVTLELNA